MDYSYAYTHSKIVFYFKQSPRDFVVEEIPLYSFDGEGAHWIVKVRKKNLTTFELINFFSSYFGVKSSEIGYAGLKDKNALTIQYLSFPKHLINKSLLESFEHPEIKILEITAHNNKIKIGHLKGNKFFIRLKKLDKLNYQKIQQVVEKIKQLGIPNYFSYQRFGKTLDNYLLGQEIVNGKKKIRDKKMQNFFISAYQSHLFNEWLSLRIKLSHLIEKIDSKDLYRALSLQFENQIIPKIFLDKEYCKTLKEQSHFFKLLSGDYLCHYPFGKNFLTKQETILNDSQRFAKKDVVPTGLLSGIKAQISENEAGFFEKNFVDEKIKSVGQRRYAWIFPEELILCYKEEEAQGELAFLLPKGAYATNLLRELAHSEIMGEE
ncbi:tRNA pseudouridine(13) synthase TruD [Helicobacter sp. 11-8110]|uniref:tRNA pseudouridine(13) synthase TruD n=1 Tax=Helicobacter sp. 11-8110 TaxID=2004997 RepID=UPI000DCD9B2F|nr:tRNA pseudouridine(13) synthase TruD [Helicobacter sp. 11-8110]RAX53492.1 tRNA pseudouridine(13) synthase TruD [Helicobacter sp. 11-8110]